MRHESEKLTRDAVGTAKVIFLLEPLKICGTLFGIVRFGWWLLVERLHLDDQGGSVLWLGVAVYALALVVIVLLPSAWRDLSKHGPDR